MTFGKRSAIWTFLIVLFIFENTVVSIETSKSVSLILKRLDALNGRFDETVVSTICEARPGVANHNNFEFEKVSSNRQLWKVGITEDGARVVLHTSGCNFNRKSLASIFGAGRYISERTKGCFVYPAWLVFERPWGEITCLMDYDWLKREHIAYNYSFKRSHR